MRHGEVNINRRRLPHWRLQGATHFITFRLLKGELAVTEIESVRDHLVAGNGNFYDLLAAMVMPDHVHAVLRPKDGVELSRIMKGIKGASARKLNKARGASGALWQDESWDRIVRDHDELLRDLDYMVDNPVRKGLTSDPWTWPGWWYDENAV